PQDHEDELTDSPGLWDDMQDLSLPRVGGRHIERYFGRQRVQDYTDQERRWMRNTLLAVIFGLNRRELTLVLRTGDRNTSGYVLSGNRPLSGRFKKDLLQQLVDRDHTQERRVHI